MNSIKPIETEYKGYRFRSRLEARWAVFFDIGGIKYEYEPQGYQLKSGIKYLPDFYLPDFETAVEVKRNTSDGIDEVKSKCANAIEWGGPIKQLLVLSDVPEGKSPDGGIWHFPIIYWSSQRPIWGWWFFCDSHDCDGGICGQVSGANYTNSYTYLMDDGSKMSIAAVSDYELRRKFKSLDYQSDFSVEEEIELQEEFNKQTFTAYSKARQARFEHGETPF